jgi:hypothetical protein
MTSADTLSPLLHRIEELRALAPDLRLGQLMAILGELGEDETGRGLWDLEDDQLAAAMDRFANDLRRRNSE